MSVIINQIELKNWFNYKGNYQENVIKFNKGLNILASDNNGGKTKLHNAFRWILKDQVIIIKGNNAEESKIDENNLSKVVNRSSFRNCKHNESINFGVRITFTKTYRKDERRTFRLTKEFHCKKDINDILVKDVIKRVQKIDNRTKKPRSIDENFEDISKLIIPNSFINFFLIEGEQLSNITPLEGKDLQTTINSIVSLGTLDHLVLKANDLEKKSDKLLDLTKEADENISKSEKLDFEEIQEKKEEIDDFKKLIIEEGVKGEKEQTIINEYKKSADNSKKKKLLKVEWDRLNKNIEINEEILNTIKQNFVSEMILQSSFSISKLTDDSDVLSSLNSSIDKIRSYISKRRTEIDSNLSNEEQKMILLLEKSQPKPEILEEMIEKGHCFVCNSNLNTYSKDYIKNKLIPFFKNESDDDNALNKLIVIDDLFKNIKIEASKYFEKDDLYFENHQETMIDSTNNVRDAQTKLQDFENDNGKPKVDEDDKVNIITYGIAVKNLAEINFRIKQFNSDIGKLNNRIKILEAKNKSKNSSIEVVKANDLKTFTVAISSFLKKLKKRTYLEFAEKLGIMATKRYQNLLKHNISVKNKIKVIVEENYKGDFEFKINVVNQINEIQDQSGGADQALRRVSVVFALLDMAENKNGYPFIADAPISRLSSDNKKEFFINLLEDSINPNSAVKQSIVMSMDLVASEKSKKEKKLILNNLGKELLEKIEREKSSSFLAIYNNKVEYLN
jgi:DNA sulfur modification protein DndD